MAQIKFEKEKLDALLVEVGNELAEMVKSEAELAKSATDDAPAEESEGSGEPTEPDADDGGAPAADGTPDGPPADASADAPPAAPEMSAAPGPEASAPGQEQQAIEPAPTVEELQAEYAKLDPEALKMHYLACKSALMMLMGADQGAGPDAGMAPGAGAPPPAAPPAPAPGPEASAPMPPPAMKGEMKPKDGPLGEAASNGGEIKEGGSMKIVKSESQEVALMKAQIEEMGKQNQALLKLVEVATKPIRKSIKGMSDLKFIDRTEEAKPAPTAKMTKSEITAKLRDKVREGKLSKADKELVSQYSVGAIDVTKIEHLLASAK